MSGEHTATPWKLDTLPTRITNGERGFRGNYRIADAYFTDALVNTPRHDKAVANAAHIVRCVNAHDELVQSLRDLLDAYEGHDRFTDEAKALLAKLDATP